MSGNRRLDALNDYAKRLHQINLDEQAAKEEAKDMRTDLKTEVNARTGDTGVDYKEVQRLARIMMDEQTARTMAQTLDGDLATLDAIREFDNSVAEDVKRTSKKSKAADEDDPLAI